ncbi:MAG: hypothetical protein PHU04_00275 [Candidatus Peribacteraceae bacterium]|nr:hypothetical protein [Candidatus Peribacteraceae bacterium]
MIAKKSASKSQKIATNPAETAQGDTPFDQIIATEQREKARVQIEIDAMRKAEEESRQSCAKKEYEAEQELREKAKGDLKKYKEETLSPLLKIAEGEAAETAKHLEALYGQNAEPLAERLVKKLMEPASLLNV